MNEWNDEWHLECKIANEGTGILIDATFGGQFKLIPFCRTFFNELQVLESFINDVQQKK